MTFTLSHEGQRNVQRTKRKTKYPVTVIMAPDGLMSGRRLCAQAPPSPAITAQVRVYCGRKRQGQNRPSFPNNYNPVYIYCSNSSGRRDLSPTVHVGPSATFF